jgi:hypothetical protein
MTDKRHCGNCSGNFELVPPADDMYTVPKLKPVEGDKDYLLMVYDCDQEGCQNRVYWYRKSPPVVVSGSMETGIEEVDNYYMGTTRGNVSRLH